MEKIACIIQEIYKDQIPYNDLEQKYLENLKIYEQEYLKYKYSYE